jgi:hypothetical protein
MPREIVTGVLGKIGNGAAMQLEHLALADDLESFCPA